MTAQKSNTGKSKKPEAELSTVPDFDLRRTFGPDHILKFASVPDIDENGEEIIINVPYKEGATPEEIRERAADYAQRRRHAQRLIKPGAFDDDYFEQALKAVTETAAAIVINNTMGIIQERFGDEALEEALTGTDPDQVMESHARELLRVLLEAGPAREWIMQAEEGLMANALTAFEREHGGPMSEVFPDLSDEELGSLFTAFYEKHREEHLEGARHDMARYIAQLQAEGIRAGIQPLERLAALLQPLPEDSDTVTLLTGQWSRAMQEGIIKRTDLQPFDKNVTHRTGGKRHQSMVRVDARLDPADFNTYPQLQAGTPQQEKLLADMRLTLAGWKEHNAALLKLHLDLTDMAYQAARTTGEERPEFIYHLGEALERQGYARNDKRRGYHPDTLQGLRQRLEALYSHRVMAWATTADRKQILARSPYWIMEEEYSVRQLPLDLDVVPALAAGSGTADAYTAVRIRPGRWWEYAEMSERRYPLPAGILRLPTDGRGRERERYALLIATFLALHVRRNQRQHAGKTVILKTGTLLEEAGITTWEEFDQMHPTQASRLRDHLHHSSEETGVFPLLRELDAFDVQVTDQEAFYASGRGWRPKFWESRLEIQIPSMGIVQKKKRGKRSN